MGLRGRIVHEAQGGAKKCRQGGKPGSCGRILIPQDLPRTPSPESAESPESLESLESLESSCAPFSLGAILSVMDERLRPEERIRRAWEYREIFDRGRAWVSSCLRILHRPGAGPASRMGLVVTKRVGKAHVRNRVKRLLREVFRRNKARLTVPTDFVFVARGGPRTFQEYLEAFLSFARKVERDSAKGGSRDAAPKREIPPSLEPSKEQSEPSQEPR